MSRRHVKKTLNKKVNKGKAVKIASPSMVSASPKKSALPVKWIVFVFALALYANTLDLQYTLDDALMITENTFTKKGVAGMDDILTNDAFVGFLGKNNLLPGGRYRPLSQWMFALEYEFFGLNPFFGHLINILLYAFLCMLLYVILKKLLPPLTSPAWYLDIAFITAILFAAHPLHTEVVSNIKGRDEILGLLLSLAVVYFSLLYLQKKSIWILILNFILFFAAILSKENAITFLAVVPLIYYFFRKPRIKDYLISTAPLILALIAYFVLRVVMIGARLGDYYDNELLNNPFTGAGLMQKYATIIYTWLRYLWLMLFPHPLTHDYYPMQIPLLSFGDYRVILSVLIFIAVIVYTFAGIRKKSLPSFAILFFIITFSIVSNLLFNIGTFMNERFLFTSLLGFVLIVAYLIAVVLKKIITDATLYKKVAITAFLLILVAYSAKTLSRNRVWMDDFTLFTTDVEVSDRSAKCNTSAGGKLIEKADSTESQALKDQYVRRAVGYLYKAIDIYPANINSWLLLGNAYIKQQNYDSSRICFERCLQINPKHPHAINNLLHVAQKSSNGKKYDQSLKAYQLLLKYRPGNTEYMYWQAVAYRGLLKTDSALMMLEKVIQADSAYADAWAKMGEIYGQELMDISKAEYFLLKAETCDPGDPSVLENLGIVYGFKKDFKRSLDYFFRALSFNPSKYELCLNISETFRNMGDHLSAAKYKTKADSLLNISVRK